MPFYTLPQMETRILGLLRLPTAVATQTGTPYSRATIVQNINSAYEALNQLAIRSNHRDLIQFTRGVSTDGILGMKLTTRMAKVLAITKRDAAADTNPPTEEWNAVYHYAKDTATGRPGVQFDVIDQQIRIYDQTWPYWRIWWLRTPAPLNAGVIDEGTTATDFIFPTTPTYGDVIQTDGFYNKEIIYFYSANLLGTRVRTDIYTGSTRTATLANYSDSTAAALSAVPDTGSLYTMLPWFPDALTDALIYETVKLFQSVEYANAYDTQLAYWRQQWEEFAVEKGDEASVRRVPLGSLNFGTTPITRWPFGSEGNYLWRG